jgi:5-methylcytosine-specific restriction protein A
VPGRFLQPCRKCGVASASRTCAECAQSEKHFDEITHVNRPELVSSAKKLYDRRWTKARLRFLAEKKYCSNKKEHGAVLVLACEVDHVIPHRGDVKLFWDMSNWQALCKACHSRKTASEDGGFGNLKKKRPQVTETETDASSAFF